MNPTDAPDGSTIAGLSGPGRCLINYNSTSGYKHTYEFYTTTCFTFTTDDYFLVMKTDLNIY